MVSWWHIISGTSSKRIFTMQSKIKKAWMLLNRCWRCNWMFRSGIRLVICFRLQLRVELVSIVCYKLLANRSLLKHNNNSGNRRGAAVVEAARVAATGEPCRWVAKQTEKNGESSTSPLTLISWRKNTKGGWSCAVSIGATKNYSIRFN